MEYHHHQRAEVVHSVGWQGIDPDRLPRYRFEETDAGCLIHGDPACLCDVKIGTPCEANASTVQFSDIAKQALGIARVDETNFHEWAELVLGMTDYNNCMLVELPQEPVKVPYLHKGNVTAWSMLEPEMRDRLTKAYKAKVPWKIAATWLPEMSKEDRKSIYKYYNQRMFAKSNKREDTQ